MVCLIIDAGHRGRRILECCLLDNPTSGLTFLSLQKETLFHSATPFRGSWYSTGRELVGNSWVNCGKGDHRWQVRSHTDAQWSAQSSVLALFRSSSNPATSLLNLKKRQKSKVIKMLLKSWVLRYQVININNIQLYKEQCRDFNEQEKRKRRPKDWREVTLAP